MLNIRAKCKFFGFTCLTITQISLVAKDLNTFMEPSTVTLVSNTEIKLDFAGALPVAELAGRKSVFIVLFVASYHIPSFLLLTTCSHYFVMVLSNLFLSVTGSFYAPASTPAYYKGNAGKGGGG